MYSELVTRCQHGDAQAWEDLAANIYPRALRRARNYVHDQDAAADIVQSSMLQLWRSLRTLRHPEAFAGWFDRVVMNEARMSLRSGFRESVAPISDEDEVLHAAPARDIAETVAFRSELFRAIRSLPLEFQEPVVLADIEGLKIAEIARRLEVPVGTVKSRLSRAREDLRYLLRDFAVKRKGRQRVTPGSLEELLYDYLEGYLSPQEIAELEPRIQGDPAIREQLEKQRAFLRVLHKVTGRKGLGLQGVVDKMDEVFQALRDYRLRQKETVFTTEPPQVLDGTQYYLQPDRHRLDFSHPVIGVGVAIAHGNEMVSIHKSLGQVQRVLLPDGALGHFIPNYPSLIRTLAENRTVTLLGSEVVNGRGTYHLVFTEKAPGVDEGELVTHVWIDSETWLPLREEVFDINNRLIKTKELLDLALNCGLSPQLFEVEIPADAKVTVQDLRNTETGPSLESVSLDEARNRVSFDLFRLPDDYGDVLHQVRFSAVLGFPIVMLEYHRPGEAHPHVVVTQAEKYHGNIPAGMPEEKVQVGEVAGSYYRFGMANLEGMVFLVRNGVHLAVGGDGTREEIIQWAADLRQEQG